MASVGDIKRRVGEVITSETGMGEAGVDSGRGECLISGDGQGGREVMVSSCLNDFVSLNSKVYLVRNGVHTHGCLGLGTEMAIRRAHGYL